jgi:hypothetical protein
MQIITSDGNYVVSSKDGIFINGKNINLPKSMNLNSACSQAFINGKLYINRYEYCQKTNTFKRTLKALWYYLF